MRLLQEREHQQQLGEAANRLDAETKRNRFFTLALDMLAIADFSGTFKQLNPSWERTLGFSHEELTARPLPRARAPRRPGGHRRAARVPARGRAHHLLREPLRLQVRRLPLAGLDGGSLRGGRPRLHLRPRPHRAATRRRRSGSSSSREQTARAAAEASERRAAFLAEAGVALTSSLDFGETLSKLVRPGRARPRRLVRDRRARRERTGAAAGRGPRPARGRGPGRGDEGASRPALEGGTPGGARPAARTEPALLVADTRDRLAGAGPGREPPRAARAAGPALDDGRAHRLARAHSRRHEPAQHDVRPRLRPRRPRPGRGAGAPGRAGRRQRAALSRLAGGALGRGEGQPGQRRVPGHALPRAAHARSRRSSAGR